MLPLYGGASESPYIYAGDGSHVMRSRLRVEGSGAFIRAASVPYWQAGRIAALVLDAMATSPETLQELKESPGWSLEQRSTGFVVHLALPFSDYGDTSPVQVSVVDAVTLDEARERGLFEQGLAAAEGTKAEVEPGANPGGIVAWWLGGRLGDRRPGFAWYETIDHPTPDDEAASSYTVVYLDQAARQEDERRRSEPWPELPDDGRIAGSVVVRTSNHPKVARCYPGQRGKLESAKLSDGTSVVASIEGDAGLSSKGRLCVAAADWKVDVTWPGADEGDLRSLLPQLAPLKG